jgi:uncharacterized cupredoxin-like copper-binding protein
MKRTVAKLVIVTMAATALVGMVAGPAGAKTKCPKGTTAVAEKNSKGKKVKVCKATTPVLVKVGETDTAHMYMTLDVASVPAGLVTFTVENEGVKVHELIVLDTDIAAADLPVNAAKDRVLDEKAYNPLGEAEDIEPGASGTLTVALSPGHYALICNIKGHVRMLIISDLTVT